MQSATLESSPSPAETSPEQPAVKHLRQVLLWPLRLMHGNDPAVLAQLDEASPWREVLDEYTGDSNDFH